MIINTKSWHYKMFSILWNRFGDNQEEKPSTLVDYILFNVCGIVSVLFFLVFVCFMVGFVTISLVGFAMGDAQKNVDFFLVKDSNGSTLGVLTFILFSLVGITVVFLINKIYNYMRKIICKAASIKIEYK